jgi:hypothetical protein
MMIQRITEAVYIKENTIAVYMVAWTFQRIIYKTIEETEHPMAQLLKKKSYFCLLVDKKMRNKRYGDHKPVRI